MLAAAPQQAAAAPAALRGKAASAASCPRNAYASNCKNCRTEPASGRFSVAVPGSDATLVGKGSKTGAGAHVCLAPARLPKPELGGVAFQVSGKGKFTLRPDSGTVYRYNQAADQLIKVKTVDRSALYQLVP